MGKDTDHYEGSLLESINDQLKAIREGQESMASVPGNISLIKDRLGNVETDVKAIKAAVKDQGKIVNKHTKQLTNHDRRLTAIEAS